MLAGCNVKQELLSPQQPGTITPGQISNAGVAGAEALRVGALGALRTWTPGGGNSNQSNIMMLGDLLTDVWKSGDTFSQHNETDQRVVQLNNSVLSTAYVQAQQSRGFFRAAIDGLNANSPEKTGEIAEMYWGIGLVEMSLSEVMCNGVPFGGTNGDSPVYTQPLTNQEGFALAIAHYDSALNIAKGTDAFSVGIKNAILVSKARTLVDMGKFAEAAALVPVSAIATSYQYTLTFSQPTQSNELWSFNGQSNNTARLVVGDSFDLVGVLKNSLPFASAKDPRLPVKGTSGDLTIRSIDRLTPYTQQQIWLNREDPIVLVSGLDARLIEAEAKLNASDIAGMMTIMNGLRTSPQTLAAFKVPAMAALPTPASQAAATDLFFREKAFWQFARGTRLGDLRRLIRQYHRTQDQVFPTGAFHKGSTTYGTDVNLPVTDSEKQNPNFHGCIDRNA
jgi:hypothetical protein